MFHDVLLEQQHVGRLVGIALAVVTAALRRQQQYCIACFMTPRMFFLECWLATQAWGHLPDEGADSKADSRSWGPGSSAVTMPACQAEESVGEAVMRRGCLLLVLHVVSLPCLQERCTAKKCQRYRSTPKCALQTLAQLRIYQALSPKQLMLQKMVGTVKSWVSMGNDKDTRQHNVVGFLRFLGC